VPLDVAGGRSRGALKKVVHVLPHPGGGGETYVDSLADMPGYRSERIFLGPSATSRLTALRTSLTVPRAVGRADLVHVHGEVAAGLCLPLLARRASVVTLHGLHLMRRLNGPTAAVAALNLRLILRAADRTICVSEAERLDLRAAVGPSADERAVVIYNGVEPTSSPPTTLERDAARVRFDLPSEAIVAAFVGSLDERKDPLVAARAAVAVAHEGAAPLILMFAGDGPLRPELERIGSETAGVVRALGFQHDVDAVLRAADFFVLPSRREGFSYALLEAMARGLPAVVSDAPGNAEAVGDTGFVVARGDTPGFAAAFRRMLDPAARKSMAARSRARVQGRFRVDEMVTRTRLVYDEATGGRR
jgi:glycosyltransferase involved in cell wall biosynthesis